jgi:hypothetical protein
VPSTDSILTPSQARARLFTAFTVMCLVVVAGMAAIVWRAHLHRAARSPSTPIPRTATTSASSAATPSSTAEGVGPITVLAGRELVNGVYLGYPHTLQGAVSAADQFMTQYLSTLDPDRGAAIARLAADPAFTNAPTTLAAAVETEREGLGIAATGQVPANYALATTPVEYQLRNASSDAATVLLLADVTSSTPATGTATNIAVLTVAMHWDGADWKLLSPPDGDPYLHLAAQPDSAQAAQFGWADLLNG